MNKLRLAAAVAVAIAGSAMAGAENGGWAPKFYPGLEAVGSVEWVKGAYKGKLRTVRLKWESGAMKFGVAKEVTTDLTGFVDWTVTARVKSEGPYGYAGTAMEFFDAQGRSLGVVTAKKPMVAPDWRKGIWNFSAPKEAKRYVVHLLSLNKEPVMFSKVTVTARQGRDKGDIPFEVVALPAEWNKDWNGGDVRMLNFSDAPLPVSFYLKGRSKALKAPRLDVDVPAELEVVDACCPNARLYEVLSPSKTEFETNGVKYVRNSFSNVAMFASLNQASYRVDEGLSVMLVIAPKPGCAVDGKTFTVRYRTMDGEKRGEAKTMEMAFRPLPTGLRRSKDFFVFSWNNVDRHFATDSAATAAANAYEAAGIRSFRRTLHGGADFARKKPLERLYEARPVKYIFSGRFGDLWRFGVSGLDKQSANALGARRAVSSDKFYADNVKGKMCPEFFVTDEKFHAHLRAHIHKVLAESGVKDGDWVTFDMEPWHSSTWCRCEACHAAFAKFAGLDHVPSNAEVEALPDKWALFRCGHNEKSVEIVSRFIREFNPTLKCVDYDYIMPYGDEEGMKARRRACGKDTLENEKWLDGHLCSYYHKIGKDAFLAMKNNVRHLVKFYVPMAALAGYGSYLRPGEVLSPRQIRQFALAAFVNGCPGYAFYSGVCFDGEVLTNMMEAQDVVARYEGLPWGKVDGKAEPKCGSGSFVFASTVRPNGSEVVALFNYDTEEAIKVTLDGREHEIEPCGVKFVERN